MTILLLFPVALAVMVLTYSVVYQALRKFSAFESSRLIAVCVALLSGLGLLALGNVIVILILLPCAALVLALLPLFLLKGLNHTGAWRHLREFLKDETGTPPRRRPPVVPPVRSQNHESENASELSSEEE